MWGHLKAYHRDSVGDVFQHKQKKRGRPPNITGEEKDEGGAIRPTSNEYDENSVSANGVEISSVGFDDSMMDADEEQEEVKI